MEDYYCEFNHQVHWRINKIDQITSTDSIRNRKRNRYSPLKGQVKVDINFHFSCRNIIHKWMVIDENTTEFLGEEQGPLMGNFVHVDPKHEFFSDNTHISILRALYGWPLSIDLREKLATEVICTTQDMVQSINSSGRYVLNVAIKVTHVVNHVYYATEDLMMRMLQESMNESSPSMVPATNSSIEALKRTKFACATTNGNCECCSICLEDFVTGCEVVNMPCKHTFHEHCITEWLGASHYCPVCRFEMPTN